MPVEQAFITADELYPALRLVREKKVAEFLARLGLTVSLHKGAAVAGKRLSRLFSPYRYWHFLPPEEIHITHDPTLNARLWDGCGLVSRAFIASSLPNVC